MSKMKTEKSSEDTKVGLKREIGLISAVNFLINFIIGSGIFITPGKVLAESGSIGMMLSIWIICGIVSFLTCLPFGELSTVVPKSGSIYIYLLKAFDGFHPFFGGLPAFMYLWITYIIVLPCSSAVAAMLFADYFYVILQVFVSQDFLTTCYCRVPIASLCLLVIGAINCLSTKMYVRYQDVLTYLKMGAIVFIIGCGAYQTFSGRAITSDFGFKGTHYSARSLVQALYLGLYSFDGGWGITGITEEIKNPEKNIVLSMLIALSVATVTYLLLNLTFLTALTQEEVADGTTVIADFAEKMFGSSGGTVAAAIISICLLTSLMSGVLYNSRIGYVAAREGHMIEILSYIYKPRQTPAPAVIAQILISIIYLFYGGDVTFLIDMCGFFMWMSYGVTMVTVFIFRNKLPSAYRPFRVPSIIPVLVIILTTFLVAESLYLTDTKLLLMFLVLTILIVFFYYTFIYRAVRIKSLDMVQRKLQTMLILVPPSDDIQNSA